LAGIYSKSIVVDASANNLFGGAVLQSKTVNVITDGPSRAIAYGVTGIPTLVANTSAPGFRIWSAPAVSNNCPDMLYNGSSYYTIPHDNLGNLTSADPTGCGKELLLSNGLFSTPTMVPSAYIDYSGYVGNAGINYSGITSSSGYRFASFCWKLTPSASAYTGLSFTINSIYNGALTGDGSRLLLMNTVKIPIFYAFQDTTTSAYSETTFNTVWINANSNTSLATLAKMIPVNTYGNLGGITSAAVTINGAYDATLNVFIPTVSPVKDSIYLYLRIAVPMNADIRFGGVSAKIT
jgi:hypothetical protein